MQRRWGSTLAKAVHLASKTIRKKILLQMKFQNASCAQEAGRDLAAANLDGARTWSDYLLVTLTVMFRKCISSPSEVRHILPASRSHPVALLTCSPLIISVTVSPSAMIS